MVPASCELLGLSKVLQLVPSNPQPFNPTTCAFSLCHHRSSSRQQMQLAPSCHRMPASSRSTLMGMYSSTQQQSRMWAWKTTILWTFSGRLDAPSSSHNSFILMLSRCAQMCMRTGVCLQIWSTHPCGLESFRTMLGDMPESGFWLGHLHASLRTKRQSHVLRQVQV